MRCFAFNFFLSLFLYFLNIYQQTINEVDRPTLDFQREMGVRKGEREGEREGGREEERDRDRERHTQRVNRTA